MLGLDYIVSKLYLEDILRHTVYLLIFLYNVIAIRWEQFFAEMSSWIALTWYTVMKTAYKTKYIYENESAGIFIMKFLNFKSDLRICILKEIKHIIKF